MQDQINIAHRKSKETDALIIILFRKKKDTRSFFRLRRNFKYVTAHQFFKMYVSKDIYQLHISEEENLRNIFMHRSLTVENRKPPKLVKSEFTKKI